MAGGVSAPSALTQSNPMTVTAQEEQRYTELQAMALEAARHGDLDALEPMLRAGMPANLRDEKGNTLLMLAASGLCTENRGPHPMDAGAPLMVGRAPLNRDGGEKTSTSALRSLILLSPPFVITRPSGRSMAAE